MQGCGELVLLTGFQEGASFQADWSPGWSSRAFFGGPIQGLGLGGLLCFGH